MANNNYEKQINDSYQDAHKALEEENKRILNEIDSLLKKSQTQELSVMDYYLLYFNYRLLQNSKEYKDEILKYKNIILEIMSNNSNEHSAEDYCCLSNIYFDEKSYDKCLEYIDKAIILEPSSSEYCFIKGEFYRKMGKNTEAEIEYSKAKELDPEVSETIDLLKSSDKLLEGSKNLRYNLSALYIILVLVVVYFVIKVIRLILSTFFV